MSLNRKWHKCLLVQYSTKFCVQVHAEVSSGSSLSWLCLYLSSRLPVTQVCMGLNSLSSMCFEPEFIKDEKAEGTGAPLELQYSVFQASSLQYEMLLLTDSISKEDSCWELRLRCGECRPSPGLHSQCCAHSQHMQQDFHL